jgi:putative transcriptional regulator
MAKSKVLAVIHDTAKGFHKAGVMPEKTMREYDSLCLPEVKHYSSEQIQHIRRRHKISQAVFAKYLNTSLSTVRQWEQGQKEPSNIALKLLSIVDKHGLSVL